MKLRVVLLTAMLLSLVLGVNNAVVKPAVMPVKAAVPARTATQVAANAADAITIPQMLSYQGKLLNASGNPVTDTTYSVVFRLYTVASGGSSFWNETQTVRTKTGLFSVLLGSVAAIESLPQAGTCYLGMKVGSDPEMTPRLQIASAAYAFLAHKADTANYALASAAVKTWVRVGGDSVLYTVRQLGIARGGSGDSLYGNMVQTHVNLGVSSSTGTSGQNQGYCAVGGGDSNSASGAYATVGGGLQNIADSEYATVGGGDCDTAGGIYSFVGGGDDNAASGAWATVAGGANNVADSECAFVGGGYYNWAYNFATVGGGNYNWAGDYYATVGGGQQNIADSEYATVGGGEQNTASNNWATVGGGQCNTAGVYQPYATVAGGDSNTASGPYSTVGGGENNAASGSLATIGGGSGNTAEAQGTVAGGVGNTAYGWYAAVAGGYEDSACADYSFAVGDHSVVPASYTNSAAFNGMTATASNQVRCSGLNATGTKNFAIDDPLDPDGEILNHYSIESPEVVNLYRGAVVLGTDGQAEVQLPDYFSAENTNPMIQLTGVGSPDAVYVASEVQGNHFVIGGKPGIKVFWTVTADRNDQSARIGQLLTPVEQPKTGDLTGRSLDDDFLAGCMQQLEAMGKAGEFSFRTAAGRQRYENMLKQLREAGQRKNVVPVRPRVESKRPAPLSQPQKSQQ